MSVGSLAVLAVLFALVGLVLWRNFRKGAPCSCGCSHGDCCCGEACRCCGADGGKGVLPGPNRIFSK